MLETLAAFLTTNCSGERQPLIVLSFRQSSQHVTLFTPDQLRFFEVLAADLNGAAAQSAFHTNPSHSFLPAPCTRLFLRS
jgi:hypothetical protein